MRFTYFLILALLFGGSAQAQFAPQPGGCPPDMVLEGFSCVYETPAPQSEGRAPAQLQNFAAAVAWGSSDTGSDFAGIGKYLDKDMAITAVMDSCEAKGLQKCEVATWGINTVIAVARDSAGQLKVTTGISKKEAKKVMLEWCKDEEVSRKILATFDGSAEYY